MGTGSLTTQLAGIVAYLDQTIRSAGQFAVEQAPDVIQQLLAWEVWKNSIIALLCVSAAIPIFVLWKLHLRLALRKQKEDGSYSEWMLVFGLSNFAYVPGICILLISASTCALNVVQILVAPKIYLIEYVSSLVK